MAHLHASTVNALSASMTSNVAGSFALKFRVHLNAQHVTRFAPLAITAVTRIAHSARDLVNAGPVRIMWHARTEPPFATSIEQPVEPVKPIVNVPTEVYSAYADNVVHAMPSVKTQMNRILTWAAQPKHQPVASTALSVSKSACLNAFSNRKFSGPCYKVTSEAMMNTYRTLIQTSAEVRLLNFVCEQKSSRRRLGYDLNCQSATCWVTL